MGCLLQPTQVLCNQLAKAWGRQGEVGEVRAVMANMRTTGIKADVYTWSSLVYACAVAGQTGKSVLLLVPICVPVCHLAHCLLRLAYASIPRDQEQHLLSLLVFGMS